MPLRDVDVATPQLRALDINTIDNVMSEGPSPRGSMADSGGSQDMVELTEIMRRVHGLDVCRYDLSFLFRTVEKRRLAAAFPTIAA